MFIFKLTLPLYLVYLSSDAQQSSTTVDYFSTSGTTTPAPPPNGSFIYRSYQTTVFCAAASPIQYPTSIEQIQQIVRTAIANKQKVKAFGSRHSLTDTICTDGVPISLQNITHATMNEDGTATVGAGAEMMDVVDFLQEHGRALVHVPAFGGITVAGAMGTGAHGSSLLHAPSLSDQLVRVTFVDGMGEIRTVEGGEDLRAFRVHLGLLGVIYEVTIETVPLFKMVVHNMVENENILLNGTALEEARRYDWYQMWWFPSTKSVVVSRGNYTNDLSVPGNATTNLIPDESPSEISSARDAFETLQATRNKRGLFSIQDFTQMSLYTNVVGKPPIFSENGQDVVNPATGYANRLQANRCFNKCPWANGNQSIYPEESAMAFDMKELPNIINTMKNILSQVQATFPMVGVFIRFSKPSDALMAIEHGRESVHVEWASPMRHDPFQASRDGIGAYQAILQAMVLNHGGRPHWGKNGLYYLSQDVIAKCAPKVAAFVNVMKKYDPHGLFMNKFGRRLTGQSNELTYDPNVRHCALQDYCVCNANSDCANLQTCVTLNGKLKICQDPMPNIVPSMRSGYQANNMSSIIEAIGN